MSGTDVKPKTEGMLKRSRRRWVTEEISGILNFLKEAKSSASTDDNLVESLSDLSKQILGEMYIPNCSLSQINSKIHHLKRSYVSTHSWITKVGFKIFEKNGIDSLKQAVLQRCPFYDDLEQIFGSSDSIQICFSKITDPDNNPKSYPNQTDLTPPVGQQMEGDPSQAGSSQTSVLNVDLELKKLEFNRTKLEFEKEKWQDEKVLRKMELEIERKKIEEDACSARYEMGLKSLLEVCQRR